MSGWIEMEQERFLSATLPGDSGPQDALVQWIDHEFVHVLTRSRLVEGSAGRLYLEIQPRGRMVELAFDVLESARPGGGRTRSWLQRCRYRAVDGGEAEYLSLALEALNPQAGKVSLEDDAGKESEGLGRRGGQGSAPRGPGGGLVAPEVHFSEGTAGGMGSLLLRFASSDQVAAVVEVDDVSVRVRLELDTRLPEGARLVLALELPGHQFIQGMAVVEESQEGRCVLRVEVATPSDRGVLRRASGGPGGGSS